MYKDIFEIVLKVHLDEGIIYFITYIIFYLHLFLVEVNGREMLLVGFICHPFNGSFFHEFSICVLGRKKVKWHKGEYITAYL